MPTVVVSAYNVANTPQFGGHFWVYLQYVHALRRLGCEVFWLERLRSDDRGRDMSAVVRTFFQRMERYGLGGKAILYETTGSDGGDPARHFIGMSSATAETVFRRADLLLNFHYAIDPGLLSRFRRTALIDIDPGLLQFWISQGQLRVAPHDLYLTIGETVGTPAARFSDAGLPWLRIRPPVCLDLWPYAYSSGSRCFTTVSSWLGGEYVVEGTGAARRVLYENDKRVSFLRFVELPARTSCELELALCFKGRPDAPDVADRELLRRKRWRVRDALEVAHTPERYRAYIQASRGEFSCAKPSYVEFQTAWVSDRTLCYLASGKPAVAQDTGPSAFLPTGEGLFRFSSLEEAAEALAAIDADYERHCRAARAIAEAFFDARAVLEGILNLAETTPCRGSKPASTSAGSLGE
jgi:hypothetical protein